MKFLLLVLCLGVQVTFAIEPPVKAGLIVHLNSLDQSSLRKSADLAPLGNGNPLDRWLDSTTNSFRATQPWALGRPVFRADDSEAFARFDGKDDFLFIEGKRCRLREVTVFILAAPRGNVGVDFVADVAFALEGDHVLETRAFGDGNGRGKASAVAVLVGDVLDEQHEQDVVLVLAGIHPATQLVAAGPEGGVEVGFLDGHEGWRFVENLVLVS